VNSGATPYQGDQPMAELLETGGIVRLRVVTDGAV
jgi:hypothetical protein